MAPKTGHSVRDGDTVEIDMLGSFTVRLNGASVTPTAPKPRQVLALLALRPGHVAPMATLCEELWGDRPPRSARTTLQTYVRQLRGLLEAALVRGGSCADPAAAREAAKEVLVTTPDGYTLRTGDDEGPRDVREFERLAGVGYRARDAGDHPAAARHLRDALALWGGPALSGVRRGPHLEREIKRLEESRLCALDQRIEADLRLGRHRELLGELTVLTGHYPAHETLHGQFMLALHRSGRRGEALDVYQRLRDTLVSEQGLEPTAALRRLQRSILATGPGGQGGAAAGTGAGPVETSAGTVPVPAATAAVSTGPARRAPSPSYAPYRGPVRPAAPTTPVAAWRGRGDG